MKKKVLGRGLEALISQELKETVSEVERVKELNIDEIEPNPNQPREHFDEASLKELAQSIKKNGILQPVVVRRKGKRYELVLGERRLRAARMAGLNNIPALVRDIDDAGLLMFALLENLQREDLNPLEEARGYARLKEQFGMGDREIADILGKDRSTVVNTLRLLKLPKEIKDLLAEGKITRSHARSILALDDTEEQIALARRIVEEGVSVRELEIRVGGKARRKKRRRNAKARDPVILEIEDQLEHHLGTRVRIVPRRKGGTIIIEYYSDEELERVIEAIGIAIRP